MFGITHNCTSSGSLSQVSPGWDSTEDTSQVCSYETPRVSEDKPLSDLTFHGQDAVKLQTRNGCILDISAKERMGSSHQVQMRKKNLQEVLKTVGRWERKTGSVLGRGGAIGFLFR